MLSDQQFITPGGLKLCIHGFDFQRRLLILLALRAQDTGQPFQLTTEVAETGQLDDAVLLLDGYLHLFQAKHHNQLRKELRVEDLLHTDRRAPFALTKYFHSYLEFNKFRESSHCFFRAPVREIFLVTNYCVPEVQLNYFNKTIPNLNLLTEGLPVLSPKVEVFLPLLQPLSEAASEWENLLYELGEMVEAKEIHPTYLVRKYTRPLVNEVFDLEGASVKLKRSGPLFLGALKKEAQARIWKEVVALLIWEKIPSLGVKKEDIMTPSELGVKLVQIAQGQITDIPTGLERITESQQAVERFLLGKDLKLWERVVRRKFIDLYFHEDEDTGRLTLSNRLVGRFSAGHRSNSNRQVLQRFLQALSNNRFRTTKFLVQAVADREKGLLKSMANSLVIARKYGKVVISSDLLNGKGQLQKLCFDAPGLIIWEEKDVLRTLPECPTTVSLSEFLGKVRIHDNFPNRNELVKKITEHVTPEAFGKLESQFHDFLNDEKVWVLTEKTFQAERKDHTPNQICVVFSQDAEEVTSEHPSKPTKNKTSEPKTSLKFPNAVAETKNTLTNSQQVKMDQHLTKDYEKVEVAKKPADLGQLFEASSSSKTVGPGQGTLKRTRGEAGSQFESLPKPRNLEVSGGVQKEFTNISTFTRRPNKHERSLPVQPEPFSEVTKFAPEISKPVQTSVPQPVPVAKNTQTGSQQVTTHLHLTEDCERVFTPDPKEAAPRKLEGLGQLFGASSSSKTVSPGPGSLKRTRGGAGSQDFESLPKPRNLGVNNDVLKEFANFSQMSVPQPGARTIKIESTSPSTPSSFLEISSETGRSSLDDRASVKIERIIQGTESQQHLATNNNLGKDFWDRIDSSQYEAQVRFGSLERATEALIDGENLHILRFVFRCLNPKVKGGFLEPFWGPKDKFLTIKQSCLKKAIQKPSQGAVKVILEFMSPTPEAFFLAVANDQVEIAKFLIAKKKDLLFTSYNGEYILHTAVSTSPEMVRMLIQNGVRLNTRNRYGWTPLHTVTDKSLTEIASILLDHGSDPRVQGRYGHTPLHLAAARGDLTLASIILEYIGQSEISPRAYNGSTPLHIACEKGHESVVRLLLQHGANVNSVNFSFRTPLDLAEKRGETDIVEYLRDSGGRGSFLTCF